MGQNVISKLFLWSSLKTQCVKIKNHSLYIGKEKMFYIGHSMGTTTYMVMNSLNQTWADRHNFLTTKETVEKYTNQQKHRIVMLIVNDRVVDYEMLI